MSISQNINLPQLPSVFKQSYSYISGGKELVVEIETNGISILPNHSWDYAIDIAEWGELVGFTIAVNDDAMEVDCSIYKDNDTERIINDRTMREVAFLGRGMTIAELDATGGDEVSLDMRGQPHAIKPYIARGKNTFSGTNLVYSNIVGTEDDKCIVLEYSPHIRETYKRLVVNVQNTNPAGSRFIHHLSVTRHRYARQDDLGDYGSPGYDTGNEAQLDITGSGDMDMPQPAASVTSGEKQSPTTPAQGGWD